MSDVTTVVVVPDTTTLAIEEDESVTVPSPEQTELVAEDGTILVSSEPSTQVIVSQDVETIVVVQESTVVVGADAAGPQGPQGPPGSGGGGTATTAVAGQALSAGRIITLAADGLAYYYTPDLAGYGKAVGMTTHAVIAGDDVIISTIGPAVLVGMGFTPGTRYWAGPNGTIVSTPPTSDLVVPVGYAVDANTFNVQIESYLVW